MVKKPYLIIPFLFEQPTWGGEYICEKKGWIHKKIGQSYELYGKSLLATSIISTDDPQFSPEVKDTVPISVFAEDRPFPLIKFTQAKGNSFQLHIMPNTKQSAWAPKAESWYFFENGKITFGVKKGIQIEDYKKTCLAINNKMKELSSLVIQKKIDLKSAAASAKDYISSQNPWQYVNVHCVKKGDVVDLSGGGLHHSWEEDSVSCPLGNILYEIQQDVMDPVSTIRSFDQGKFKEDGTIREIQVEDYFNHLDLDEKRNTLIIEKKENGKLFNTPFYSLTSLLLTVDKEMESTTSFHHLFVKEGKIRIVDKNKNEILVGRGHSCFVPKGLQYLIKPKVQSEVLLTYLR